MSEKCKKIDIEWVARWKCPDCGNHTDSDDSWVNDDGDYFFIVDSCGHLRWDSVGGLELEPCGFRYTVDKRG